MDNNLKDSIDEFINAIRQTSEYRNYRAKRLVVMEDHELRGITAKLMKEHYRLLTNTAENDLLDAEIAFVDKYEDVYNIPEVHDFFDAENRFNSMLRDVLERLTGGLSL